MCNTQGTSVFGTCTHAPHHLLDRLEQETDESENIDISERPRRDGADAQSVFLRRTVRRDFPAASEGATDNRSGCVAVPPLAYDRL
ncbi:hypothetical protein Y032_0039g19 [Ancylostoma ceylanicum]|uniref:Uncharacterized protein n=1 Tax=Ancylostoma ceylanicum TaxID=53326 RepID=A0A016UHZ8_9BILA|nr:hypothetical protein Y032_0039g19 [Ancylostoma ceylanicum]